MPLEFGFHNIGEKTMTSQFADLTSSLIFFWHSRISLVKFSYWSKFNFNIMTSSEVMTIFIYEFCPIIGDWDKLGIPNFAVMSLIAAFTVSGYWWKTNRRGKITPPPPPPTLPRLGLIMICSLKHCYYLPWGNQILYKCRLPRAVQAQD